MENELVVYQNRLKPGIALSVQYDTTQHCWSALIATKGNRFPYWQIARGATPGQAWRRLKGFLDGGPQLHDEGETSANDFIMEH